MLKPDTSLSIKSIPTPFYYYDIDLLSASIDSALKAAGKYGYKIHYALKANADKRILSVIRAAGMGADCVSGNEVLRAVETGFAPTDIFYAGVGKTDNEIVDALESRIGCFNCESIQEIGVINEKAGQLGRKATIALRINPNIESHTHSYITTGMQENKFGIQMWELDDLLAATPAMKNIIIEGIHVHVGSQITDMEVFKNLSIRINELNKWFADRGVIMRMLDLGGGLGIDYHEPAKNPVPDFEGFFKIVNETLEPMEGQTVHFELGRSVVGQMGSLITKVLYTKKGKKKNFVVTDAAMTELIRPALYGAFHKIENISKKREGEQAGIDMVNYDVVGPVCETSDFFAKEIDLPLSERGDILAIRSAGAYAESMSMNYNLRKKVKVVYSDNPGI